MKSKFQHRKNQAGQAIVEMLLMLSLLVGMVYFIGNEFRSKNFIAQLVSGPWMNLAGMIQNGVWGSPDDTMPKHPNSFTRVSSPVGDEAK